jgi:hypothetical protein
MHDALAHMQATADEALRDWSSRVLALVDGHLADRHGTVDPRPLASALAEAAYWPASPRARDMADQAAPYRRIPLTGHPARGYEALLILWPPGHVTPIHDHAGLWGIELVLDGVLEVEAFALSLQQPAPRLVAGSPCSNPRPAWSRAIARCSASATTRPSPAPATRIAAATCPRSSRR